MQVTSYTRLTAKTVLVALTAAIAKAPTTIAADDFEGADRRRRMHALRDMAAVSEKHAPVPGAMLISLEDFGLFSEHI